MPTTLTTSPAIHTLTASPAGTCPAWCTDGQHEDGSPHIGGMCTVDLSLDELLVTVGGELLDGSGWLDICLRQDGDSPVISMAHNTWELPDMTVAEAEALAKTLLQVAQQAKAVPVAA
jgi:hypothetical protein